MAKKVIPSAKAAKIMDITMILVEAPGLRPVASAAFAPTKPTPMADPSAASPTWMLPDISAIRGNNDMLLFFLLVFDVISAIVAVLPRSDYQIVQ